MDSGNLAGDLLVLTSGCRGLIHEPFVESRMFAGVGDALQLLREVLGKITDARRTQTVTRKQLSNAIESLAALVDPIPRDAREWAARFVELREFAQTAADIAEALAQELDEPPDSELRAWAEAVRNSVESNLRDARIIIPWLRLDVKEVVAMAGRSQEESPEWVAIESRFRTLPTLADAPERFASAIRDLAPVREKFAAHRRPIVKFSRALMRWWTR